MHTTPSFSNTSVCQSIFISNSSCCIKIIQCQWLSGYIFSSLYPMLGTFSSVNHSPDWLNGISYPLISLLRCHVVPLKNQVPIKPYRWLKTINKPDTNIKAVRLYTQRLYGWNITGRLHLTANKYFDKIGLKTSLILLIVGMIKINSNLKVLICSLHYMYVHKNNQKTLTPLEISWGSNILKVIHVDHINNGTHNPSPVL